MFLGGVFVFCACENLTEYEGIRSDYAHWFVEFLVLEQG